MFGNSMFKNAMLENNLFENISNVEKYVSKYYQCSKECLKKEFYN
jgi:hypothetical protein